MTTIFRFYFNFVSRYHFVYKNENDTKSVRSLKMEFEKHFCKQKSLISLSRTLLANFALANVSLALLSTFSYAEQSQSNAQNQNSTNSITLDNIGGGG